MKALRILAIASGLGLHATALALLIRSGGSIGWIVVAHVTGSIAWGLGAAAMFPGARRTAWWQPAAWALAFPVAGPLASLAFAAILRGPEVDRSAKRYIIWNDQPHGEWSTKSGGAAGQSIVEILQSPRTQLRRSAVLALRDLDPQVAIPLLRKGLQDSDEQVRIYAQNILSTMLERFEQGIKQLEQRLGTETIEPAVATRLAEQYFELVYLDVAGDEETAAHYLSKALALLEHAANGAPDDGSVAYLGFKYALRARDVPAARRWHERLDAHRPEAQHVQPWRMELAFLEGDWPRLRTQLAEFVRAGHVNPRIEELARFWNGPEAAARS